MNVRLLNLFILLAFIGSYSKIYSSPIPTSIYDGSKVLRHVPSVFQSFEQKTSLEEAIDTNDWQESPRIFFKMHNWIHFRIENKTLAKIPINITDEWDFVKEIEVVLIQNGNEIFRSIDGFSYKGTNPFKPHDSRFPSWTLDLPSGVTDVYVRYHGIAFNAPRIILSSPEAFHDRMFTDHNIIGFILGMMLAIAFYNFGIFLASNDQTFAYYSLYLFLFAIFLSSVTGFIHSTGLLAYDYFPGAYLISMLLCFFFLAVVRFCCLFLALPDTSFAARSGRFVSILGPIGFLIACFDLTIGLNFHLSAQYVLFAWLCYIIISNLFPLRFISSIFALGWSCLLIGDFFTIGSYINIIPYHPLNEWGLSIAALIEAIILTAALGWKVHKINKETERLQRELDCSRKVMARTMQQVINSTGENIDSIQVKSLYHTAEEAGGDWLFVSQEKGSKYIYVIVGDVTDHGMSSAMITSLVRGVVTTTQKVAEQFNWDHELIIKQLSNNLNHAIYQTGQQLGRLMTANIILLKPDEDKGWFLNAGHPAAFIKSCRKSQPKPLYASGSILGLSVNPSFKVKEFHFPAGAQLLCYTDGIIEQEGSDGSSLSLKQLSKLFGEPKGSEELLLRIEQRCHKLWDIQSPQDDISLLILEREIKKIA